MEKLIFRRTVVQLIFDPFYMPFYYGYSFIGLFDINYHRDKILFYNMNIFAKHFWPLSLFFINPPIA
jgi:hypothetical protein